MSKILITAFEAFNNLNTNSSMKVLEKLHDKYQDNDIIKKTLPVSYKKVPNLLKKYLEEEKPDVVILLGQAGGETKIRVEKIAVNFIKASIPDNDGLLLDDVLINEDYNMAYLSLLPTTKIINALENKKIPCYLSLSAGGFLCNYTMFHLLHLIDKTSIIGGFIHLPFYKGQQDKYPDMDLEKMIEAIETICSIL